MTKIIQQIPTVTLRKPKLISNTASDLVKFQNDVDEFCKKHKVVEKHYSFQAIPTGQSKVQLPGIQQRLEMQMSILPVCYMVYEEETTIDVCKSTSL